MSSRTVRRALAIAALALPLLARNAHTNMAVPSSANSTIPATGVACPGGDGGALTVVVRDFANVTIPNSVVYLDVCDCPSGRYCSAEPNDGYTLLSPCTAAKVTNAVGQTSLLPRLGGACAAGLRIYADGVWLGTRPLASVDQDGDLAVTAGDVGVHAAKIGTNDLSGDFDGNLVVNAADAAILAAHMGHTCLVPTQVRSMRWGSVKVRYR